MNDFKFLKRFFNAYYSEKGKEIPLVNFFEQREFGFIPWDKQIMMRHMSFKDSKNLNQYLITNAPRHMYISGALYKTPEYPEMSKKNYQGCDLIVDIDVDHFYTPCKGKHDIWHCNECQKTGTGMIQKCPKCRKTKFTKINWICEDCLEIAKKEIKKLIYEFLIPDFGIKENDFKVAFSGHRGYHLKVENKRIRSLSSEDRREIADYLTGNNLSLELIGLSEFQSHIYGLSKDNIGWSQKILEKIEYILYNFTDPELKNFLLKLDLNKNVVKSFMNSKKDFLQTISNLDQNLWSIEGFGLKTWKKLLNGIISEVGARIDEPVTIDIHRLIRYPGSLHGKTGFRVQELKLEEIEDFKPLNESKKELNPLVFESDKIQKLEIKVLKVPETKVKDVTYGPYTQGEKIKVPNHIAIFLLCKDVAKTI